MLKNITSEEFRFRVRKYLSLKEYWVDIARYLRFANFGYRYKQNEDMFIYMITKYYHIIEKGLTMPSTRIGFGREALFRLTNFLNDYYDAKFDLSKPQVKHAVKVLNEYIKFSKDHTFELDESLLSKINYIVGKYKLSENSSQITIDRDSFFRSSKSSFEEFFNSRYSVRHYTEKDIELDILNRCVSIAMKSPSACNRQPNKVHIVKNRGLIDGVLALQSGNRGFGHLCNTLLVVTSDISAFYGAFERYAPHFNSGMFVMSLVNSLHYFEIGNCVLNWSTTHEKDLKLRKLLNIADNEFITVILSCGYPPEQFKIATSPRKQLDSVISYHL